MQESANSVKTLLRNIDRTVSTALWAAVQL